MNRDRSSFRKWILGIPIILCLAVLIMPSVWIVKPVSSQDKGVRVKNRTGSFQVVSTSIVDNTLLIRLKNISNKAINGYTLSLRDGGTITVDYTISGHEIAPGQFEDQTIPLDDSSSTSGSTILQPSFGIEAVVFADNSGEGDVRATTYIREWRKGEKLQLKRILPLLKQILDSPDGDLSTKLRELKSQILALPEKSIDSSSLAVSDGLHDARQDALSLIRELEENQQNTSLNAGGLRKKIMRAVDDHERRALRLPDF